jgi:UDP-N-acetylmuramyl-tripeptide synthetase
MMEENPAAVAVVNLDDEIGRRIAQSRGNRPCLTYGIDDKTARLRAQNIIFREDGALFEVVDEGRRHEITTPLHGRFNVMNTLTALGLARAVGMPIETALEGCRTFHGAPGRFEVIPGLPGVKVIVDYAHTPDALSKVLQNARPLARGRVITVFGCGGDRDNAKRPLMGRAAVECSDAVIVTHDNPRTEAPERIIGHILEGFPQQMGTKTFEVIQDRRRAIHTALDMAVAGDIVVVAGKGHEDYQILGDKTIHFDDREVARECIAEIMRSSTAQTRITHIR